MLDKPRSPWQVQRNPLRMQTATWRRKGAHCPRWQFNTPDRLVVSTNCNRPQQRTRRPPGRMAMSLPLVARSGVGGHSAEPTSQVQYR